MPRIAQAAGKYAHGQRRWAAAAAAKRAGVSGLAAAAATNASAPPYVFEVWDVDRDATPNETMPYLDLLRQSVFTLCPAGDLWDSYRAWESIHAGSIPIVIKSI